MSIDVRTKGGTGGGGAVTSVFTRVGAVTAQNNDYTWAQVDKTVSSIADIATKNHTDLTAGTGSDHTWIDQDVTKIYKTGALTDAATVAVDLESTKMQVFYTLTITADRAMGAATNQVAGCQVIFKITESGAARALTWNANYLFGGGNDVVLSLGDGSITIVGFVSDGTNLIHTGTTYDAS